MKPNLTEILSSLNYQREIYPQWLEFHDRVEELIKWSAVVINSEPVDKKGINKFQGSHYNPADDEQRLTRQIGRVYAAINKADWLSLSEIAYLTGDPEASISAQLRNLRKAEHGSHTIKVKRRGDRSSGLFEYKLSL